jgi:adenosylcobinamide-GDP ribazoletransferase
MDMGKLPRMDFDASAWKDGTRSALAGWGGDLAAAASFLTRLPLGAFAATESGTLARSMRAFPLIGLVVGLLGWAAYAIATALGLPSMAAALLAVATTVLVTGGLHEDGLADSADGLGGGADRDSALAIMRDSRSGAYGVLALVFSVALRAAALAVLTPPRVAASLIAAHVVSRAVLPILMRCLEPARNDGLGADAGRPDDSAIGWCLALGIIAALLSLGFVAGLVGLVVAALAIAAVAGLARRRIGGYTGDVLGAAQQVGEIAMLLTAAAAA